MINWTMVLNEMGKGNPMHEGTYKVGIYLRSGNAQEKKQEMNTHRDGLERMVAAISRLELQEVYEDNGCSGCQIGSRTELKSLLCSAKSGEVDIILTNSLTRLARDMKTLMEIADLLADVPQVVGIVCEKEGLLLLSTELKVWTENMARGVVSSRHMHRVSAGSYPTNSMPL